MEYKQAMLLPDNINPENTIYYNGAIVLKILQEKTEVSFLDLFGYAKEKKEMSFATYILCLDWLYLIGVAFLNNEGDVVLCF